MTASRFRIAVDTAWQARLLDAAGQPLGAPRAWQIADDGQGGKYPLPPAGEPGDPPPDAAEWSARLARVTARKASSAVDVRAFGRYAFDVLLGAAWWAEIGKCPTSVELALDLPTTDRWLHRLPWELAHDGQSFLAGRLGPPVAFTRLIQRKILPAAPLGLPPRLLFVIGAEDGDGSLRAGAECMGLLRQAHSERFAVHPLFLKRPSLARIKQVVAEFRPHLVHMICHGVVDVAERRTRLELWDDAAQEMSRVSAAELAGALVQEAHAPGVVVLSACHSGIVPGAAARAPLLAPDAYQPLAAALVEAGVPLVLGMGGRIGDLACRVFARSFGRAFVAGEPLVWAAAAARRAALQSGMLPETAVDWSMLNVFLADDQPAELAAKAERDPAEEEQIERWLQRKDARLFTASGLRSHPAFCGREDAIDAFHQLLYGGPQPVLGLCAPRLYPGEGEASEPLQLGKTHLLRLLASMAVRAGHVPVPLLNDQRAHAEHPRDLARFLAQLADRIVSTRRYYKLPEVTTRLAAVIGSADPQAAIVALGADLVALRDDARKTHAAIARASGQVIVFLDDVDEYGSALTPLLTRLLSATGLGDDERIPVVMSFTYPGANGDQALKAALESGSTREWLRVVDVRPIPPGEEMLAYQTVLLHPFRDKPPEARQSWWLETEGDDLATIQGWTDLFHQEIQGAPGKFGRELYQLIKAAKLGASAFARPAGDEDILAKVGGK